MEGGAAQMVGASFPGSPPASEPAGTRHKLWQLISCSTSEWRRAQRRESHVAHPTHTNATAGWHCARYSSCTVSLTTLLAFFAACLGRGRRCGRRVALAQGLHVEVLLKRRSVHAHAFRAALCVDGWQPHHLLTIPVQNHTGDLRRQRLRGYIGYFRSLRPTACIYSAKMQVLGVEPA